MSPPERLYQGGDSYGCRDRQLCIPRNHDQGYSGGPRPGRFCRICHAGSRMGLQPARNPPCHGLDDRRHNSDRQYRLRLVHTVGDEYVTWVRLCSRGPYVGQLLHLDNDGEQCHRPDRCIRPLGRGYRGKDLSRLRIRLQGYVLFRPCETL